MHVECQSLAEAREAIAAGADIIMLDNFTPTELNAAAAELRQDWVQSGGEESERKAGAKRCLIEVSGGLTEENLKESLCPGALLVCVFVREGLLMPLVSCRRRHPLDFGDPPGRLDRRL